MKLRVFFLLIACFLVVNCGGGSDQNGEGSKFLVVWPSDQGDYHLQVIESGTIQDASSVSGEAAKIYVEPKVSDEGLSGTLPNARFIQTEDGVLVPSDFFTAQLIGLYLHIEKLWEMDRLIGVADLLVHPRKYGMKARIHDDDQNQLRKNNAMYDDRSDSTLIMPFEGEGANPNNQLPIALNAGIIAHEHFHALFDTAIGNVLHASLQKFPSSKNLGCHAFAENAANTEQAQNILPTGAQLNSIEKHNYLVMRAINEALADVWGWLYSGDNSFMTRSLPNHAEARALSAKEPVGISSTQDFANDVDRQVDKLNTGLSYRLGTQIARLVFEKSHQTIGIEANANMTRDQRLQIARSIVAVFPQLRKSFEDSEITKTRISTTVLVDLMFKAPAPATEKSAKSEEKKPKTSSSLKTDVAEPKDAEPKDAGATPSPQTASAP